MTPAKLKTLFCNGSELEAVFRLQIEDTRLPDPITEYRFHLKRKWRFDFAWPDQKLAVEIEGGTYRKSRHTSGTGFHNDCEKYNAAVLEGWKVFRFDSRMVNSLDAIRTITEAFNRYNQSRPPGKD